MPRPLPTLEVPIHAMAIGGDGVGRDEGGRVVFVPDAAAGDRVRVRLTEAKKRFARGEVIEVLDGSADRVAPPCPHVARGCGGCDWQHLALDAQRRHKAAMVHDAVTRLGRLPADEVPEVAVVALPATGFRTTVRAAVVDGRAGFLAARSHRAVPVDSCLVAHPLLEPLLAEGRFGDTDEVVLRCGPATGERLAVTAGDPAAIEVPDDVVVVGLAQADRTFLHDVVAGRRWRISAASFFQTRADGAEALVEAVGRAAGVGERSGGHLVDLYGGVGLLGGALAGPLGASALTVVESSASSVADARVNLADLDAEVVEADVRRWAPVRADTVIADPSRAGLGAEGVEVVTGCDADRVVLVSCDLAAAGRDAGLLADAGYRLATLKLVDLFPHTHHGEVVARYDRIS